MPPNKRLAPAEAPCAWLRRWHTAIPAGGAVLDVAAGGGRHSAWLLARGHPVTAVDRDVSHLAPVAGLTIIEADLETPEGVPCGVGRFAGVVMVNYLWRPILGDIAAALAPGGVLIAETFAAGNEAYGRPRNRDFLLRPGELLAVCRDAGFAVLGYQHGRSGGDPVALRQGVCARRPVR